MTALRSIALLFGLGLLQIFLPTVWSGLGGVDWLLIYVVLQSLQGSFRRSILLGAGAGLIQDGLAGGIIGLHAFAKTTVAAVIATFGSLLVVRGPLLKAAITGVATALEGLIVVAWQLLLGRPASLDAVDILVRAAVTGAATMVILYTGRRWQQRALIKRRGVRGGSE
ncbi:MAG: rod shape-determining protein MreD [Acidobacteria bacterium]|nr:rod shape-determining protein MreD [Acidobacteriota bacterium]